MAPPIPEVRVTRTSLDHDHGDRGARTTKFQARYASACHRTGDTVDSQESASTAMSASPAVVATSTRTVKP